MVGPRGQGDTHIPEYHWERHRREYISEKIAPTEDQEVVPLAREIARERRVRLRFSNVRQREPNLPPARIRALNQFVAVQLEELQDLVHPPVVSRIHHVALFRVVREPLSQEEDSCGRREVRVASTMPRSGRRASHRSTAAELMVVNGRESKQGHRVVAGTCTVSW